LNATLERILADFQQLAVPFFEWARKQLLGDNLLQAALTRRRVLAVSIGRDRTPHDRVLCAEYDCDPRGPCKEWGFDPDWLLAKSTLHPTVYNDPEAEGRIRSAIEASVIGRLLGLSSKV
jgi:hypothetical protein